MTALSGAITADQDYVPNPAIAPGFYQLDDELIRVRQELHFAGRGRAGAADGRYIDRPLGTSSRAAHTQGTTFTPVGDPAVPSEGGGGSVTVTGSQGGSVADVTTLRVAGTVAQESAGIAVQTLVGQQLGPVAIAFEDITPSPAVPTGFVIPDGALVETFAVLHTDGDAGEGAVVELVLYPSDDLSSGKTLVKYDMYDGYISPTDFGYFEQGVLNSGDASQLLANAPRRAIAKGECTIGVKGTGAFADGSLDVYAIIATPAS